MKKIRPAVVLIAGFLLGWCIWEASGQVEAWDAPGVYYPLSLFVAGVAASMLSPRHFWLAPVGVGLGQLAWALNYLPGPQGPFWPIGLMFGIVYCGLSLIGGAFVYNFWRRLRKPKAESK